MGCCSDCDAGGLGTLLAGEAEGLGSPDGEEAGVFGGCGSDVEGGGDWLVGLLDAGRGDSGVLVGVLSGRAGTLVVGALVGLLRLGPGLAVGTKIGA